MKKLILLFASLFLVSGVFAQHQRVVKGSTRPAQARTAGTQQLFRKPTPKYTPASVIFSEDFANGLPSTWANVDSGGMGQIWTYTLTGSSSFEYLDTTGTTASNGYMIFDSDFYYDSLYAENADLITPSFDCSGHSSVFLSLNEYFVQFNLSKGTVSVSTDSVNWTDFHSAEAGLVQNQSTANPNHVVMDISSVAANQAHVYLRFNYRGQWDYYWMIDDITVYEPSTTDAGVTSLDYPFNSSCLSAAEPVFVTINNFGSSPISNFPVSIQVNGGTPITENVPSTIAPGTSDSYLFNATIDLSAYGNYNIDVYTGVTGDAVNTNDTSHTVITNIAPQTLAAPIVMDFEAFEDLTLWAVQDANNDGVGFGISGAFPQSGAQCARKGPSGATDDDWVLTPCYDLVAGATYALSYWYMDFNAASQCNFEVKYGAGQNALNMTNTIIQHSLPGDTLYHQGTPTFTVPVSGAYNIGFHAYNSTPSGSFRLDNIRLSNVTGIATTTNDGGVSVYPNPTSGLLNITVMKYSNATLHIYNMMGAEVLSQVLTSVDRKVDVSSFENGLYVVKITGPDFTYSEKITITK